MPPLPVLFSSWTVDPVALILVVLAAVGYGLGLRGVHRAGGRWPLWRTLAFVVLGLGSFVVLSCGFVGVYGPTLRWAFAVKLSLYLFLVPILVSIGRPLTLARAALGPTGRGRLERWATSRPMRLVSNPILAPLIGFVLFMSFVTPWSYTMRTSPAIGAVLTVLVPVVGLLMILPNTEEAFFARVGGLLMLEFVFVFAELLLDAIPGVVVRLSGQVLDQHLSTGAPLPWFPNPLRDQQIAGDSLWFIAEIIDLPLIILMFVRFSRTDATEARSWDELSDDEFAELSQAHLDQRFAPPER
ncbi:cytochrome c oxidase assembly protein [Tersicoccus sp. MR15.9]|uniref:cytochrome c oxidase assembly protein n=1 Tax=Tersicoccus mangrovi TaxID=3121635 RepID=UPI002FE5D58D